MNKLEEHRQYLSISHAELARRVNFPKVTVWRHCKGTLMPDANSIAQYIKTLGLLFEELRPDLWSPPDDETTIP